MIGETDQELAQQQLTALHQAIREAPNQLVRFICEAVLGIKNDNIENPFMPEYLDESQWRIKLYEDAWRRCYSDLASIYLNQLNEINPLASDEEFLCLKNWIASDTSWPTMPDSYWASLPSINEIIDTFFIKNGECLAGSISYVCMNIYNGVPLYEKNIQNDGFTQLPFSHEEYIYLSLKGKYFDTQDTSMFPEWAKKYYVRREHLDAHKIFFSTNDVPDENANAALRLAYRRHIGVSETRAEGNKVHKTKLLSFVNKVIERYYGDNFDISDRNTHPTQASVVAWLTEEHNLSRRQAEAVDIVSRPDGAR